MSQKELREEIGALTTRIAELEELEQDAPNDAGALNDKLYYSNQLGEAKSKLKEMKSQIVIKSFYPNRRADVVKLEERRCTIETDTTHATLFDNVWGYSVGYLKKWDDGRALIYCCGRRDIRFNLVSLPEDMLTFSSEAAAMEFFLAEYATAMKSAEEYGERVLEAVREAGLPELIFDRPANDGDPITCIMQVGFSGEYVDKCVKVECTPQEALALLNHKGIVASCEGSRHADFMRETSGRHGFLAWFSNGHTLTIGIGTDAKSNPIASCLLADWRK